MEWTFEGGLNPMDGSRSRRETRSVINLACMIVHGQSGQFRQVEWYRDNNCVYYRLRHIVCLGLFLCAGSHKEIYCQGCMRAARG